MNLDAVIFDMDDTLYCERDYVRSGMAAVARWASSQFECDRDSVREELMAIFKAQGSGRVFNEWLDAKGLDESWVPAMVDAYRQHTPEIELYDGVAGLLKRLKAHFKLGVMTDGYLEVQKRKVAALGIEALLDVIVYSDELGREFWKPSTRPFEVAEQQLGVEPVRAVYVADNPNKDFRGARQLGMKTVRVRYPGGLHFDAEAADSLDASDAEIASLLELEAWLFNRNPRARI